MAADAGAARLFRDDVPTDAAPETRGSQTTTAVKGRTNFLT